MTDPGLLTYITESRARGMSDEVIKEELLRAGWLLPDVAEGLQGGVLPLGEKPVEGRHGFQMKKYHLGGLYVFFGVLPLLSFILSPEYVIYARLFSMALLFSSVFFLSLGVQYLWKYRPISPQDKQSLGGFMYRVVFTLLPVGLVGYLLVDSFYAFSVDGGIWFFLRDSFLTIVGAAGILYFSREEYLETPRGRRLFLLSSFVFIVIGALVAWMLALEYSDGFGPIVVLFIAGSAAASFILATFVGFFYGRKTTASSNTLTIFPFALFLVYAILTLPILYGVVGGVKQIYQWKVVLEKESFLAEIPLGTPMTELVSYCEEMKEPFCVHKVYTPENFLVDRMADAEKLGPHGLGMGEEYFSRHTLLMENARYVLKDIQETCGKPLAFVTIGVGNLSRTEDTPEIIMKRLERHGSVRHNYLFADGVLTSKGGVLYAQNPSMEIFFDGKLFTPEKNSIHICGKEYTKEDLAGLYQFDGGLNYAPGIPDLFPGSGTFVESSMAFQPLVEKNAFIRSRIGNSKGETPKVEVSQPLPSLPQPVVPVRSINDSLAITSFVAASSSRTDSSYIDVSAKWTVSGGSNVSCAIHSAVDGYYPIDIAIEPSSSWSTALRNSAERVTFSLSCTNDKKEKVTKTVTFP